MVPGHQAIFQPFYICHTCSDTDDFGVCAGLDETDSLLRAPFPGENASSET